MEPISEEPETYEIGITEGPINENMAPHSDKILITFSVDISINSPNSFLVSGSSNLVL